MRRRNGNFQSTSVSTSRTVNRSCNDRGSSSVVTRASSFTSTAIKETHLRSSARRLCLLLKPFLDERPSQQAGH